MRFRGNADRLTIDGKPGYVGVRISTQAESDERVPKLLTMPVAVGVVLVTPREQIDWWRSVVYQKDYYCAICEKWFDHSAEKVSCRDCGEETVWADDSCPECDSIAEPDMICPECGTDGSRGGLGHAEVCQQEIDVQHGRKLNWVIVQGGDDPVHPDWVRGIRDRCQAAGVPFYFAGWGDWYPMTQTKYEPGGAPVVRVSAASEWLRDDKGTPSFARVGSARSGRLLDGRTWDEMPTTAGKAGVQ